MESLWSAVAGVGALLAIAAILGAAAAVFRTSGLRADVERLRGRVDDLTKERDDERAKRLALEGKVQHQESEINTLRSLVPSGEQLSLISTTLQHLSATLMAHHEEAIMGHDRLDRLVHDALALLGARRQTDQPPPPLPEAP